MVLALARVIDALLPGTPLLDELATFRASARALSLRTLGSPTAGDLLTAHLGSYLRQGGDGLYAPAPRQQQEEPVRR